MGWLEPLVRFKIDCMNNVLFVAETEFTYSYLLARVNSGDYESIENRTAREICRLVAQLVSGEFGSVDELISSMICSGESIELKTSGTTGTAKSVSQSIATMIRNVKVSDNRRGDVWGLCYEPTRMAWYQVVFQAILNRSTLVELYGCNANQSALRIEEFGVTHLSATPTWYRLLDMDCGVFEYVKQVTFGGERMTENLMLRLQLLFPSAEFRNVYASTEAGSLFSGKDEWFRIPDRLHDLVGLTTGELLLHRSLVSRSVLEGLSGDWYHTGDMVELRGDGLFRIMGRKGSMVNVGGVLVNLEFVEECINSLDEVLIARVESVHNSVLGNVLRCIMVKEGDSSLQEIRMKLKGVLDARQMPRKFELVESIDVNSSGKLKR